MFDTMILGRSCPDREYDELAPTLRVRLFEAQRQCLEHKIPLLITICGVDGSGRGAAMNLLSEWMDSKFMRNYVFWMETDEERERPLEWRYWRCLPGNGETAVFFSGWYGATIRQHCCGDIDREEFLQRMHQCRSLEASLANSGMAIVKLWLHLDEKTHDKRLKKRLEHKTLRHFTPYDRKSSGKYDEFVAAASTAITMTDRAFAPWCIIDAADSNFRNMSIAKAIIDTVERIVLRKKTLAKAHEAAQTEQNANAPFAWDEIASSILDARQNTQEEEKPEEASAIDPKQAELNAFATKLTQESDFAKYLPLTTLEGIDLSKTIDPADYKKELRALQNELQDLTFLAYKKGVSSTLIFEGMDAAGKGGCIRRLMNGVDARIARIIPISSPTDEELAHHYLWRFWRHIPRAGFVTIYDRSWYGRVLVERVEKLTAREDWSRAYSEINLFEQQLINNKNILLKFWLHISQDEELRRFKERENTPWKRYKITPEDWRNRAKWSQYLVAADEMFLRTSTSYAPWHIISAEDKKYARIQVLKTWRDTLKKVLKDDLALLEQEDSNHTKEKKPSEGNGHKNGKKH